MVIDDATVEAICVKLEESLKEVWDMVAQGKDAQIVLGFLMCKVGDHIKDIREQLR